jgi:hypothetical protein
MRRAGPGLTTVAEASSAGKALPTSQINGVGDIAMYADAERRNGAGRRGAARAGSGVGAEPDGGGFGITDAVERS